MIESTWKPAAKVIRDSLNRSGDRLVTFEVDLHRFVLAELNTHRVLSRNSASSRAIPLEKMLDKAKYHTAIPVSWPKEQAGMQGGAELEGEYLKEAKQLYLNILNHTVDNIDVYLLNHPEKDTRLHKSVINRLLEPFLPHTAILSGTQWEGFFAQRLHKDAQPEIHEVAKEMKIAMDESVPIELSYGEYHTPYIDNEDIHALYDLRYRDDSWFKEFDDIQDAINAVSVARCARVSYLTHDMTRDISKDLELYFRLRNHKPAHASPFEHVARPSSRAQEFIPGNFVGWEQLRHLLKIG